MHFMFGRWFLLAICWSFVAIVSSAHAQSDAEAQRLRYRWKPGKQYAYQFRLEADGGDEVRVVDGSIVYSVNPLKTEDETGKATGTAFVVTSDGCLVTCAHCVEAATDIKVRLGGKTYAAKVVGWNQNRDLALIRIDAKGLPTLPLGTDKSVELAESVRAVGFPLSTVLGSSVKITGGTIAGFIQRPEGRLFQVDASINPGNSGGPLVDSTGAVIGVNSAKLAGAKISNVAFSVPVGDVKKLLERYKVKHVAASDSKVLAGPDLARRVVPAVAMLEITIGPGGYGYEAKHIVTFSARMQAFAVAKKDDLPKWGAPPPGARSAVDRGSFVVDATGVVHALKAKLSLPYLLGALGQLPVEPLGAAEGKRWSHESTTTITVPKLDDSDDVETFDAIERYDYQIFRTEGETITVRKNYELSTPNRDKSQPQVRLAGSGGLKLDRTTGIPLEARFKATLSRTEGAKTESIPFSLAYKRVEPKVIDAIVRSTRPVIPRRPHRPSTPAPKAVDVESALANLKLDDPRAQRAALALLAKSAPSAPNRTAAARLEELLASDDPHLRNAAVAALKHWHTKESVPALIAALEDKSFVVRHVSIATLGMIPDPRGADAIVGVYMANKIQAHRALIAMGSAAEPAVQKMLTDPNWGLRAGGCKILIEIGTDASLRTVRELAASDAHGLVRMAARKAAAKIEGR
jgi:S1-C subfamily serine protease